MTIRLVAGIALLIACSFRAEAVEPTEIVAAVLIGEAGGEGARGMEAVHEVVENRAALHHLTEVSVVTKSEQFSCLNGTSVRSLVAKAKRHPRWKLALEIAAGKHPTHLANGATHYDVKTRRPSWSRGLRPVAIIGNHAFYSVS